jgi:hypothetical protein
VIEGVKLDRKEWASCSQHGYVSSPLRFYLRLSQRQRRKESSYEQNGRHSTAITI